MFTVFRGGFLGGSWVEVACRSYCHQCWDSWISQIYHLFGRACHLEMFRFSMNSLDMSFVEAAFDSGRGGSSPKTSDQQQLHQFPHQPLLLSL